MFDIKELMFYDKNISFVLNVADSVNLSNCPPQVMASILLENVPTRVELFYKNRLAMQRAGGNMTYFAALDGSNHTKFLEFWRTLGFRLNPKTTRGWMRSYGAVSATLSHLNALRLQVENRIPYLLRLEDDIYIQDPLRIRQLCCYLNPYLLNDKFRPFNAIHFNMGGMGSPNIGADVYLTSINGARQELRRLCMDGIYNGFDFMVNPQRSTMHVASVTSRILFRRKNAPSGHGSVVTRLKHFKLDLLVNESSNWSFNKCLRWSN